MEVPENLQSKTNDIDTIDERDKNIHWKLKAQAAKITFRLFSKHASLRYMQKEDKDRPWVEYFQSNFAELLCESHLQLLLKNSTHFIGTKTLSFAIKLVSSSTKIPLTMKKMLDNSFID